MVGHEKLPNFSFPLVPRTSSESHRRSSSTRTFSPITITPPAVNTSEARPSKHRRNNAMSTRRNGMLIYTATPTSNPSIPPVPKVPESLNLAQSPHRHPLKALQSQPLARSLSDVSSCPTLEADIDEPLTPDSLHDFSTEVDYFNFKTLSLRTSVAVPKATSSSQRDSEGYDGDESEPSDSQEQSDDMDDDDEEFWSCRGLNDPTHSTFEPQPLSSRQSKESDGPCSDTLFATNEDPLDCYSDYEHWLQSVASRTRLLAGMTKDSGAADASFSDYMGLIRNPLLA